MGPTQRMAAAEGSSLCVVIPALNEAAHLPECIRHLYDAAGDAPIDEVIVADCGSVDGTVESARQLGLRVVHTPVKSSGRAAACAAGAVAARAQVILFLDADTRLQPGFRRQINSALADADVVGGAFRFQLIEKNWRLRMVEWINRIRYTLWREYYGDQAVFVRREALNAIGGYPQRGILESAWLCRELKKTGRLKLCRGRALTSGRRFLDGGVFRVLAADSWIWLQDQLGFDVEGHGRAYWQWNAAAWQRDQGPVSNAAGTYPKAPP